MIEILLLHGPNLNLTGVRQPDLYGTETLDGIEQRLRDHIHAQDIGLRSIQSNHEGELIDALHECRAWAAGVVFNPGALAHYSYALRDAVTAIMLPVIEVHMSLTVAREPFRHTSVIAPACAGAVSGFGWYSYTLGLEGLLHILRERR